jgi:hypothetical protein
MVGRYELSDAQWQTHAKAIIAIVVHVRRVYRAGPAVVDG